MSLLRRYQFHTHTMKFAQDDNEAHTCIVTPFHCAVFQLKGKRLKRNIISCIILLKQFQKSGVDAGLPWVC